MITKFISYEQNVRNLSKNTCKAYEKDLRLFASYIKVNQPGKRWSTIEQQDIEDYEVFLHQNNMTPATIRRKVSSIHEFYWYLIKEGLMTQNPAQYVRRPKNPNRLPNTIDATAIEDYISDAQKPIGLRAVIAILYETGIRVSELIDLKTQDFNPKKQTIRINGKGAKERIVYYGHWTSTLVEAFLHGRKGQLFEGTLASQRQLRYEIWQALKDNATNGKASPHTIRHTFATRMLEQGMSLASLQIIMGHENANTTANYARLTNATTQREYRRATA